MMRNPNYMIEHDGKKEIWYDPYNMKVVDDHFGVKTRNDLSKNAKFVGYAQSNTPPPPQPKKEMSK